MNKHLYHVPDSGDVYVAFSLAEAQEHLRHDLKAFRFEPADIDADAMDMRQVPDDALLIVEHDDVGMKQETAASIAAAHSAGALTNIFYADVLNVFSPERFEELPQLSEDVVQEVLHKGQRDMEKVLFMQRNSRFARMNFVR